MSERSRTLGAFARLLSYPVSELTEATEFLYVILQSRIPEAAEQVAAFGEFVERHTLHEQEETFTHTFDINPACALEVGWHLFGEEYDRGQFLVRLREEMRKYKLPESAELPDHLVHVLAVVAAMPRDEAHRFVTACVFPAVEKMQRALSGKETPYRHVIDCLALVLRYEFDIAEGTGRTEDTPTTVRDTSAEVDLLQRYPLPNGLSGSAVFVPLQISFDKSKVASEDIAMECAPLNESSDRCPSSASSTASPCDDCHPHHGENHG
jgi:nitrate reductase molybdenum cofactor assembly chaperone